MLTNEVADIKGLLNTGQYSYKLWQAFDDRKLTDAQQKLIIDEVDTPLDHLLFGTCR